MHHVGFIRTQFYPDPARKLSANLYNIHQCCVCSEKAPDDGQRNCPKHVEFYSKNEFEKLVHFVGFIRTQFHPDPARKLSANLYNIDHCCVYSEKTPDDGQRNCPKHVEFYSKNEFEELVHLVGFIVRNLSWGTMCGHINVKTGIRV
jgi:hypothetical protein